MLHLEAFQNHVWLRTPGYLSIISPSKQHCSVTHTVNYVLRHAGANVPMQKPWKPVVQPAPKAPTTQQPLLSYWSHPFLQSHKLSWQTGNLLIQALVLPFFFLLVWAWLCRRAASFPACESAITKHMYVRDLSNKAAWKIIGMEIKCQHLLQDEPHPSWQSSDPQFDKREEVAPNFFVLAMTSLIKNNPGKHLRSNTCAHIHLDFPSHCSAFYQKDFLSTT